MRFSSGADRPADRLPWQRLVERLGHSDTVLTLILLALFMLTNRYYYGWDDQHLEIPLLKHLIDPNLYRGDYYVESLSRNFTSFLYPLLSRVLRVEWIPSAYLTLYLAARGLMFFFTFRLWTAISGSRAAAFAATAGLFLLYRPEEFIYRTFSHQEFSYIFVFAGLYLIVRNRYLWAALLFGIGANIHALYNLFPMAFLSAYLLLFQREQKGPLFLKSMGLFLAGAAPFIIWTLARALTLRTGHGPDFYDGWLNMYHLSCPQNFLFGTKTLTEATASWKIFFADTHRYFFLAGLFLALWRNHPPLRTDRKLHALALTVAAFFALNFCFTYILPSHFVLDLNLIRTEQFLTLFLGGYAVLAAAAAGGTSFPRALFLGTLLVFCGGKEPQDVAAVLFLAALLEWTWPRKSRIPWSLLLAALGGLALVAGWGSYPASRLLRIGWSLSALAGLAVLVRLWPDAVVRSRLKHAAALPVLGVAFIGFCQLHHAFYMMSTRGGGFWQLQRNWEDMQRYVRDNTPADAVILAPNDMEMGGFRTHSNRSVVVCYRDCGIVGFDYGAAREWLRRMRDTEAFKVMIDKPFTQALINGIRTYGATHVVFMRYAAPPENPLLHLIYDNEAFALYAVRRN